MTGFMQHAAKFVDLTEGRGTRVNVADTPILLVRQGDKVHAFSADCPHAGGPLEEDALCNDHIICPWHKGTFDATTGKVLESPALISLDRYPVAVRDGKTGSG